MAIENSQIFTIIRLGVAFTLLGYAAYTDVKTRTAENWLWLLMGGVGMGLIAVDIYINSEPLMLMILVPIAIVFLEPILDYEDAMGLGEQQGKMMGYFLYFVALLLMVWLHPYFLFEPEFQPYLVVLIAVLAFEGLYYIGVLVGGADAKALMALAILFPFYPKLLDFPLLHDVPINPELLSRFELVLPFAFLIMMNAAILHVFFPLYFYVKNFREGVHEPPYSLFGYKASLSDVKRKHLFLMEFTTESGETQRRLSPKRDDFDLDAELEKLKKLGKTRVWVTPKIPFLIPITIGLFMSFILGNLFLIVLAP